MRSQSIHLDVLTSTCTQHLRPANAPTPTLSCPSNPPPQPTPNPSTPPHHAPFSPTPPQPRKPALLPNPPLLHHPAPIHHNHPPTKPHRHPLSMRHHHNRPRGKLPLQHVPHPRLRLRIRARRDLVQQQHPAIDARLPRLHPAPQHRARDAEQLPLPGAELLGRGRGVEADELQDGGALVVVGGAAGVEVGADRGGGEEDGVLGGGEEAFAEGGAVDDGEGGVVDAELGRGGGKGVEEAEEEGEQRGFAADAFWVSGWRDQGGRWEGTNLPVRPQMATFSPGSMLRLSPLSTLSVPL